MRSSVSRVVAGRTSREVFTVPFLREVAGHRAGLVVGPAWYGYLDPADFVADAASGVRLLTEADAVALRELAAATPGIEWEHSAVRLNRPSVVGAFRGGTLVSVASWEIWEAGGVRIGHIGVLTHPEHRGRGHGRAVVSVITHHALRSGIVPQYRTLRTNGPALAIGRGLGYQEYAESIAVRLNAADARRR
jgi:GNAT superfamily N-acetyltransferase